MKAPLQAGPSKERAAGAVSSGPSRASHPGCIPRFNLFSGFVPARPRPGIPLGDNGDIGVLANGHQLVVPFVAVRLLPIAVSVFLMVLSRDGLALIRRTTESRTHLESMRERRTYVSEDLRFTVLSSTDEGKSVVYAIRQTDRSAALSIG